jgi:hypothetical protein
MALNQGMPTTWEGPAVICSAGAPTRAMSQRL